MLLLCWDSGGTVTKVDNLFSELGALIEDAPQKHYPDKVPLFSSIYPGAWDMRVLLRGGFGSAGI